MSALEVTLLPEDFRPHDPQAHRRALLIRTPSIYGCAELRPRIATLLEGDAWDLKDVVVLAAHAAACEMIPEDEAWRIVAAAASAASARYDSWEAFGQAYAEAFDMVTDGRSRVAPYTEAWRGLPWLERASGG